MMQKLYGCEETPYATHGMKEFPLARILHLMGELFGVNPETNPVPGRGSSVEVVCDPEKEAWVPCQMCEAVLNRQDASAQGDFR